MDDIFLSKVFGKKTSAAEKLKMSESLGEKLRLAREERGITLGEVAEQTRISSIYLESIENDDYRNLPGGIFNKGFVRSFAKYVGVNEQEALMDYNHLVSGSDLGQEPELKVYRPEVLTDDRRAGSMVPTVVVAAIILAAMTAGILFLLNYLRRSPESVTSNSSKANSNITNAAPANVESTPAAAGPDMATLKVEFKTTTQPVRLSAVTDGAKSDNVVAAASTVTFEPKESLTLNYNRWNASVVQLFINGKQITLPAEPLDNPKAQRIEFTISKDNLAQIWESGSIGPAPAATLTPTATPDATTTPNPETRPPAQSNPAATPYPTPYPTPRPGTVATPLPKTPGNTVRIGPTPKPTIIVVPRPGRTPTE